ncbi:HEAT repeat domain-containing protein [Sandaracinus amylolyticus]|uniref:HEAT repeat domain-containing protein n=1 Tax=Sandaracinus amylolyticus TaxID=927083 RepID=UPI001F417BFF|nr:HEAT repeat domain-containing protein [Sandaracinus amylolyticus]UJR80352.1 PBS lyase HEAT repeat-like domain protein [Sandaracinus amylolyticus]
MVPGRLRRLAIVVMVSALLSALLSVGIAPLLAHADARTDYLVRLLRTSEAFRVRAQAALSLGSVTPEPQVIDALTAALRDDEAAVRAAAASSLERLGDPSALPALRAASSDRERAVADAARSAVRALERVARTGGGSSAGTTTASTGTTVEPRGTPRFYVGVGMPGTKVAAVDRAVLASARGFIASRVQQLEGVVVAPESESPRQAQQVIRQRSLTGFYLDSSIVSLETRPDGGVRAQVSVVVQTYPDRNVRSMLNGAATVMGETGVAAQRAAIEGALNGALRNLGTAMGAGSPR